MAGRARAPDSGSHVRPGGGLAADAVERRLPQPMPAPSRLPAAVLRAGSACRPAARPQPRLLLSWLLLGADAGHVRGRRRPPGLDGCALTADGGREDVPA